jgi:septum site-determining protein MinC
MTSSAHDRSATSISPAGARVEPGRTAVELKGFSHPALRALVTDASPVEIARALSALRPADPAGFEWQPVVIDLSGLAPGVGIDLRALCDGLRGLKLHPVALAGANPALRETAESLQLGVLAATGEPARVAPEAPVVDTPPPDVPVQTQVIDRPIRSGQQVYARNADLIVVGAVSPGAEVMADGNIQVYGSLQGRALAGARGRRDAAIFALDLQAELVAVAGVYRTFDDGEQSAHRGRSVRVTLDPSAERLTVRML